MACVDLGSMTVVVTGLPRSGTSMMMQMLAAGGAGCLVDAQRPADRFNPRGYMEFAPVASLARDAGFLDHAAGKAVKIVIPHLFCLPTDPDYRLIFMLRDIQQVARSQQAMARANQPDQPALDEASLVGILEHQLDQARRFVDQQFADHVLYIPYQQGLADPAGTARQVNALSGDRLDEKAMANAVDPMMPSAQSHPARCCP
jgi:hypothetical protein